MSLRSFRVLMIAPTSFFSDYGCHVRILEEARSLQALGHRVTIATYRQGASVPDLDIRRTLPIPWRHGYEVGSSRHKIALDGLLAMKTLELLARERFDVIHAHLHEGALIGEALGKLWNIPVVFDFQGSLTAEMVDHGFLNPSGRWHRVVLALERWITTSAPVILTSSQHARQLLLTQFRCPPGQVRCLPDGVNAQVFVPRTHYPPEQLADRRRALGIPPHRKVIVYLGLLAEYQGTSLLLEALRHILQRRQDVHLLLMGFPHLEFYQDKAFRLGIAEHVTFTGRVPYAQAPIYLALGDVAVSPKLSLTEGAGKLLNYMAVGLPTVAFDTPVAREYLGDAGLYAAPGDAVELAERLYEALFPSSQDIARIQSLGARLRERAMGRFSWDVAGREIAQVYEQVVQGHRARLFWLRRLMGNVKAKSEETPSGKMPRT
ncbi:MAG: glycosyltransferase family 4 protein [Anaerolineae bacterium]|nr:glycosyltransferase family 4 protein [Anaerolineae bacterium]MDW8099857.1 glycosyltransferase family 4 protein [Anaerolineae bacterium]